MDKETVINGALFSNNNSKFKRRIYINMPDSKKILYHSYKHVVGHHFKWLPEYDEISSWLASNEGKGLFLYGSFGRGKTLFLKEIFPVIMESYRKVCSYYTMTGMDERILNEALGKKIICLDDVGVESKIMSYGNERHAFPELMDRAEQNGNLVVVSTNLSGEEIEQVYGTRTLERIKACCKRVNFNGESLRS